MIVKANAVRWTARIWSLASMAFVLPFWNTGGWPSASEAVALLFFPVGVFVGFIIAWRREAFGGLVSVASLAAFYGWMGLQSGRVPGGPYFLLLSAPALLFLVAAAMSRAPTPRTA